jgi:hypothetical protein
MGDTTAAGSRQRAVSRTPLGNPRIGRPEKNERPHPPAGREDTPSIIMSPGHQPADLGKPGCLIATIIDRTISPHPEGGPAHNSSRPRAS